MERDWDAIVWRRTDLWTKQVMLNYLSMKIPEKKLRLLQKRSKHNLTTIALEEARSPSPEEAYFLFEQLEFESNNILPRSHTFFRLGFCFGKAFFYWQRGILTGRTNLVLRESKTLNSKDLIWRSVKLLWERFKEKVITTGKAKKTNYLWNEHKTSESF